MTPRPHVLTDCWCGVDHEPEIRGDGDDLRVRPSDSRAGSQAGSNGPSGSLNPSPRRDPSAATPSPRELLGYVAVGLAPFAFAAFFGGMFIWPVYFGIALLALLFLGAMWAAIFVWPYEED